MAADSADVRLARLAGAYTQTNERLGAIEQRVTGIEARIDRLDARIDELSAKLDSHSDRLNNEIDAFRSEMTSQFYWLLGVIILGIQLPLFLHILGH